MVARNNEVIADNSDLVRFTKSACFLHTSTDKTVCNVIEFEYEDTGSRYTITFTRADDVTAAPMGAGIAYHRFIGGVTIEAMDNGTNTRRQGEALWELMYLGDNLE